MRITLTSAFILASGLLASACNPNGGQGGNSSTGGTSSTGGSSEGG